VCYDCCVLTCKERIMASDLKIQTVGVLGAGVMGAQIAAHFANAGFEVFLYDLPAADGPKNGIAANAIKQLSKLKPAPFANSEKAQQIFAKNYEDDLAAIVNCQLIIEAVAERFDIKQSLYQKIAPYLTEEVVFASNTSGLSINKLGDLLPASIQQRFCGVHFFNPPRYMTLLELIPSHKTNPQLLDELETFFVRYIGKGVVRAKDTPNFIANRVGVFSMLATVYHAQQFNIPFEVVDALTGTLIGRPKSATFRTMDVVGLDTMAHVVKTMQDSLTEDPWHEFFQVPEWLSTLVEKGALGQKSRAGIYQKQGKEILVWRSDSQSYEKQQPAVDSEVLEVLKNCKPNEMLIKLKSLSSNQAQFLWSCFRDVFHYCAYHLETIANTPRDIDLAIRWGFGWQQGPFETWQLAGFAKLIEVLKQEVSDKNTMSQAPLPAWLDGLECFYQNGNAFEPKSQKFVSRSNLSVYNRQLTSDLVIGEKANLGTTLFETDAVRLWTVDKEVAVLSFKSKANCIGEDVLDGMQKAIDIAEQDYSGLVLWQHNPMNFSVGANLKQFIEVFEPNRQDELKAVVYKFQRVALRLKYSSIPTVAALRGRALGGGCEFLMHCDDAVAALESYVGLVEVGVGLLPAGGGLKELVLRANEYANGLDPFPLLERYFKMVAMAEVSASGLEAKQKAFLKPTSDVVLNTHEVLYLAIEKAKGIARANYLPPAKTAIPVLGRDANARLMMLVVNMAEGGFISEHDKCIAEKIAYVMSGGDLDEGTLVDEEWLLRMEIEAFAELAQTEKTKARVQHLLETGKPLRN
jgi:3-hydroxyacyl-CoA dehydrogenase